MAAGLPYRRGTGEGGESGASRDRTGGMPGWVLAAGFALATPLAVLVVAGPAVAAAVLQTWIYSIFVLPLVVTAGMLGMALTGGLARQGFFSADGEEGGSPWPDMYHVVMAVGLGLGVYALAMLGLGCLHLMNPWVAVGLQIAGAATGFLPARKLWQQFDWSPLRTRVRGGGGSALVLLGAVPVAILLIAATFPPGSLWTSEGRGYDVLEYHLEMPREYMAAHSTLPAAHNVYSYLPANVEMLYLQLMEVGKLAMDGGSMGHLWGVYPSQFLHLLLALLTVMAVGLAPLRMGIVGRVVAMLVVLGIPWTVVTGSLAYDEWGMMLFGTLALSMALKNQKCSGWKAEGILIGALLGLAVGCKLTAGIAFAVPVAAILLMKGRWRSLGLVVPLALAVYSPWAIRAAVATHGNPLFPLAANVLGSGHWTPQQVTRFEHGHAALSSQRTLAGRMQALATQSLLDEQWSPGWGSIYRWAGEAPPPAAMWWKHLGILWLIGPVGLLLAFLQEWRTSVLLAVVVVIQLAGWMALTHLQSRFLLPLAVPLALWMGLGADKNERGLMLGGLRLLLCTVVGGQALCAGFLLLPEAGLFAGEHQLVGRGAEQPPIGELFSRVVNIPAVVEQSPTAEGTVLMEGNSAVLFWQGRIVYNTVFDHNPLGDALRAHGPAGAAAWLREQGVNDIVFDWSEIRRLRATYGFDEAITLEAVEGLMKAGITPAPVEAPNGWTILQVRKTTQ